MLLSGETRLEQTVVDMLDRWLVCQLLHLLFLLVVSYYYYQKLSKIPPKHRIHTKVHLIKQVNVYDVSVSSFRINYTVNNNAGHTTF